MPGKDEFHEELDTLRGRIDSVEKEVDQRLDVLNGKLTEQMMSSNTRHGELLTALGQLTKSHELADQRAKLNHESVLAPLQKVGTRLDVLEASRVGELQKLLDERAESGRHWLRYVVTSVVTLLLAAGGWILGHVK